MHSDKDHQITSGLIPLALLVLSDKNDLFGAEMAQAHNKVGGAPENPSTISVEWSPGSRTQSWDALWRRVLGDILQNVDDPTKAESAGIEKQTISNLKEIGG